MFGSKRREDALYKNRKYFHHWEIQQYGKDAAARHLKCEIEDLRRIYKEAHGRNKKPASPVKER